MPDASTTTAARGGPFVLDVNPDFCLAVSLLAALESATEQDGHAGVLPFLGMARAELTDFGHHRQARYIEVEVTDLRTGLRELAHRMTELRAVSSDVQRSLGIESSRRLLERAIAALT